MKVLVACEESQEVCKAFRAKGHEAFSCDIQECSGGHPEWHIKGDVIPLLNGNCTFLTEDLSTHTHRAVGSHHRTPAMHSPCRFRRQVVPGKAKGFPAAESMRLLHVLCIGAL